MGSNTFGKIFTLTTAGESHGAAYVGIIDGVPSNCFIDEFKVQGALNSRAPGNSPFTSKRKESDKIEFLSGLYQGKTTGAPIAFIVRNFDVRREDYEEIKDRFRPGHADLTYHLKYQNVDKSGGGRASGRETLCRVVGGEIAKQILQSTATDIDLVAAVQQIHTIRAISPEGATEEIRKAVLQDPLGAFDPSASLEMQELVLKTSEEGDSLGGSIVFQIEPMIGCLGEPVYGKLTNRLADALFTIPAVKGVVFADVFEKKGSTFVSEGILGGISNGEAIRGEIFFKPPSSIRKVIGGRHDPVIVPRARIVVESMLWMVLLDLYLEGRCRAL